MLKLRKALLHLSPWKAELALLIISVLIYSLYFQHILLNINTTMSSITSDTLKNYFTFAFHIRHDQNFLHFKGMNYPFGEHVVYTDCQPILCFILRLFPFWYDYSIGILHGLIFFSFMVTPLVMRRIFLQLHTSPFTAWLCGLAISLLSPQFLKLNAGHFGLAYTALIPLAILWLTRYMRSRRLVYAVVLLLFNVLVFMLHPYMGLGLCVLCGTMLLIFAFQKKGLWKNLLALFTTAALPLIFFKLFMLFTDDHPDRTNEPYGLDVMVENVGSVFSPEFGPMRPLLEAVFPARTTHYEGHSYVGFAVLVLLLALPVLLFFPSRKRLFGKTPLIILTVSLLFLFVSFGWHHLLLRQMQVSSASVNQFRAVCRFAWFFYYGLGIYLVWAFDRFLSDYPTAQRLFAAAFLAVSFTEAHYLFRLDEQAFWKWRNIFNKEQLTAEELYYLDKLKKDPAQCVMPLPLFHTGSEIYERTGTHNSVIPAMICAYHSGMPIASMMASRTSISETEQALSLLNTYQSSRPALSRMDNRDIFVIRSATPLMPDEDRAWKRTSHLLTGDSTVYGRLNIHHLLKPAVVQPLLLPDENAIEYGGHRFIYRRTDIYAAFRGTTMQYMQPIAELPAGRLPQGRYVLSFRFYFEGRDFHSVACNVVLARDQGGNGEWLTDTPMRIFSGFYGDFNVFEHYLDIRKNEGYVILIYGHSEKKYRISDLMIRPEGLDVMTTDGRSVNNFPR